MKLSPREAVCAAFALICIGFGMAMYAVGKASTVAGSLIVFLNFFAGLSALAVFWNGGAEVNSPGVRLRDSFALFVIGLQFLAMVLGVGSFTFLQLAGHKL
jgi:hypothetical protein